MRVREVQVKDGVTTPRWVESLPPQAAFPFALELLLSVSLEPGDGNRTSWRNFSSMAEMVGMVLTSHQTEKYLIW